MKLINNLIIQIIPFLPKFFVKIVASPYIAGISDNEMLDNVKKLNDQGFEVAIDILGEHVQTEIEAKEITDRYISIYDEISKRKLSANISIKLTHIGQDLGYDIVKRNLSTLVQAAKTEYQKIGIVIQAYLHRSVADINNLSNENFNVRVCKGIYVEDPKLVLNDYQEIRD